MLVDFENRIRAFPWDQYTRAEYGAPVPETLLSFLADTGPSADGCRTLELCLFERDCLTEATSHAVPFLLELVARGHGAHGVYEFLSLILVCADLAEDGLYPVDEATRSFAAACRQRVAEGLPLFLRHLQAPQIEVDSKSDLVSIVCRLPALREQWLPVLRHLYEAEPDPHLHAELKSWLDVPEQGTSSGTTTA